MIGRDAVRTDLSPNGDETGESRRKRLSQVIVRNSSAGVYTTVQAVAKVTNPSARMRCMVALGYRLDSGEPGTTDTPGWTATLYAFVKHGQNGGLFLPANQIIPGPAALPSALPWSYETDTMVDQLAIFVSVPNAPGSGARPGNLWVTAAWEPVSSAIIGDGELEGMFRQCALKVDNTIAVSQSGA